MGSNSVFVVRESFGTYALQGPPTCAPFEGFRRDEEESRFTGTSPDKRLFAVGNSSLVNIFNTSDGSLAHTLRHRLLTGQFSRNGGFLVGWDNPNKNHDNFNIWALGSSKKTPDLVYSQKLSKPPETQFSGDEKVYARLANDSIIFAEIPDFHNTAKKTPEGLKVGSFSLSPGQGPLYVFCYIPATKSGEPSFARLYRYPNFDNVVASKSFFQADRVDVKWNGKGSALLLTTMTDIDKTGGSYYGKTMLHYMDLKGETATVQTENDSNVIHSSKWSPTSTEFCVISGKMPNTRAVLLNTKCDKIFEMGIAARNEIYFNPQGNILLLCGFGNLPGSIEIWEIKKHKKLISSYKNPNTTQLEWLSDGVHFITATTAPRMQVDNSFKIWDFTGKCVFEWKAGKQLFGVTPFFRADATLPFPEDKLDEYVKKLGNKGLNIKVEEKKVGAYVPIHKRKGVVGAPISKGGGPMPNKPGGGGALTAARDNQLSEKEKKIKNLKKKLEQIDKLKETEKSGAKLEKNQVEKISKESELLVELEQLELS